MNTPQILRGDMESFEIRHIKTDGSLSRIVILRLHNKNKTTELVFEGILDTNDVSFSVFAEMIVQITDLSDKGWERQCYYVEDICEHSFSFWG